MAVFNEPAQWDHTLGNNADASTLPDDSAATAGTASLQKLFQLINATPLEAGGIAPDREDVNALFKYLGDQIFYTQNGGVPSYNADYDYVAGRVVLYNGNLYKCIQNNGASSTVVAPDSDTAYWQRLDNYVRSVNGVNADAEGNVNVIANYKNTNDGYIQFGNGLIFAWASLNIKYGGTVVNKPKPFTTLQAYITDQASSRTARLYNQACVPSESTNTTDTFISSVTEGASNDGSSVFWIGKV